jgi:hypothetical protein
MFTVSTHTAGGLNRLKRAAALIAGATALIMLAALSGAPVPEEICLFLQDYGPFLYLPFFVSSIFTPRDDEDRRWPMSVVASAVVVAGLVMTVLMEIFVVSRSSTSSIAMIFLPFLVPVAFAAVFVVHILLAVSLGTRVEYPIGDPQCAKCGYCLIGNMSGICPECGWPATN